LTGLAEEAATTSDPVVSSEKNATAKGTGWFVPMLRKVRSTTKK
jgi:hypothetical protein